MTRKRCCFDFLVRQRRAAMLKTIFIISMLVVAVSAQVEETCDFKFESVQNNTDFFVDDVKVVACRSTGCESLSGYENIYQVVKNKTFQMDGASYCMNFLCFSRPIQVCVKSNNITLKCTNFTDKNITEIGENNNLYTHKTAKNVCPASSDQSSLIGGVVAACAIIVSILVIIVIVCKARKIVRKWKSKYSAAEQANIDQRQRFQEALSATEERNTTIEKTKEDESTSGSKAIRPMSSYKDQKFTIPETVGLVLSRQSEEPNPGTTSTNDDQDI